METDDEEELLYQKLSEFHRLVKNYYGYIRKLVDNDFAEHNKL